MLLHGLFLLFALLNFGLAIDLSTPLSCRPKDQLSATTSSILAAATSRKIYGSTGPQGSILAPAYRCPRIKPTVTITSTIKSGTTTVPTSPGFTPILSETYSVSFKPNRRRQLPSHAIDPIFVSLDSQGQVTTSASESPQSMICGPDTAPSSPTLSIPTSCTVPVLTTTTITTVAAFSSYDACAAENLVNQGFDKGTGHGLNLLTLYNVTSNTGIDVSTPYDCCVACQMLGCAYGGYLGTPHNVFPYTPYCYLYFQDRCDPKEWVGNTFTDDPDAVMPPSLGFTVFNGPCGQIVYGGSSVCKDPPCM